MEFSQQNINQSETRICNKKMSVGLYTRIERSMWYLCLNFKISKFMLQLNQSIPNNE